MEDQEEKEITLRHNEKYIIKVIIKKDLDYILKAVQEKLYYTDDEMKNININFLDDDGYENMLDEDSIDEAFEAKEWTTSKKDNPGPNPNLVNNEEIQRLKNEISQLKSKIRNSNSLQESIKKCNETHKLQIEKLKNKFIEELKQRETLNKKNLEKIHQNLTECAQDIIKSKVEGYNNKINTDLNNKVESSKVELNKGINELKSILDDINKNKEEIKKQIGESNINFSKIFELSKININDNQ